MFSPVAFTPKGGCPLKRRSTRRDRSTPSCVAFTPKGGCTLKQLRSRHNKRLTMVAFTPKGGCPLKHNPQLPLPQKWEALVAFTPKGGCLLRMCGRANRRSPLQGCVSSADKGASLRFVVRGVRTLFCPHPRPLSHSVLITRQFLGELAVRQILPPLLQVPPAGGGNQTAVPLAKQEEPNGGGLQKVSCNEHSVGEGVGAHGSAPCTIPLSPACGRGR